MTLSCIVAVSENGVIGRDNDLPWHLPADLNRFKSLTMGHPIVMGRKTYDSIGRPLPGRRSVVLTRSGEYAPEGVTVVGSLEEALDACEGESEVFVIGGASLFSEALPRADRLYLTRVHADVEGDTFFPPVDFDRWLLADRVDHPADEKNEFSCSFERWDRGVSEGPGA